MSEPKFDDFIPDSLEEEPVAFKGLAVQEVAFIGLTSFIIFSVIFSVIMSYVWQWFAGILLGFLFSMLTTYFCGVVAGQWKKRQPVGTVGHVFLIWFEKRQSKFNKNNLYIKSGRWEQ